MDEDSEMNLNSNQEEELAVIPELNQIEIDSIPSTSTSTSTSTAATATESVLPLSILEQVLSAIQSDATAITENSTTIKSLDDPIQPEASTSNLELTSPVKVPKKRGRRSVTFAPPLIGNNSNLENGLIGLKEDEPEVKVSRFTEAEILNWRNTQIDSRQTDLMAIVDRHDDYVRELFHLDRFVTLIGFDPVAAKADKSDVFLTFQANYDLFMNTSLDPSLSNPTGSRRATRRSSNQRKDGIVIDPTPTLPAVVAPVVAVGPRGGKIDLKGKGRASTSNGNVEVEVLIEAPPKWGPQKGVGRGNGRRKSGTLDSPLVPVASTSNTLKEPLTKIRKKRGPNKRSSAGTVLREEIFYPQASSSKASTSHSQVQIQSPYIYVPQPISKRAKHFHYSSNNHTGPTILYSHASQLVDRAPFGGSLPKFLESYLDNTEEGDPFFTDLESRAKYEADILTRAALHRLNSTTTELFNPDTKPSTEFKRLKDHQDNLIEHVVYFSKLVHDERKAHILTAKKIGRMVLAHFDRLKGKDDREKKEEERGRKALARWTVKEVRKKWKLAVNVVRARRKARVQVEQERIGKEQLNAMLDKSTTMLQAQQVEMAASDESSEEESESVEDEDSDEEREEDASDDEEEEEEDEEEDNEEEEEEEEEEERSGDEEVEDEDEEAGTSALASPSISSSISAPVSSNSYLVNNNNNSNNNNRRSHLARSRTSTSTSASPAPSSSTAQFDEGEEEIEDPSSSTAPELEVEQDDDEIFDLPKGEEGATRAVEDDAWEAEMEADEEGEGEDSDSELGGLAEDADLSIEELMKRSGYGAMMEAEALGQAEEEEEEEEVEEEEEEEQEDEEMDDTDLVDSTAPPSVDSSIPPSPVASTSTLPRSKLSLQDQATQDAEESEAEAMSEFGSGSEADQKRDDEDEKFEEMMDEDDGEKSDDSEMDGLAEDAELSIEELRKKYAMMEEEINNPLSEVDDEVLEEEEEKEEVEEEAADVVEEEEEEAEEEIAAPKVVEKVNLRPPFLLRGSLRPYQQAGMEWLASLYASGVNGILADEMGLGKTIQTISLLAHLACDKGVWGPHLVVVPTSVMLNWEMEFKKFLPGFKILTYYGTQKERKEKRKGWNTENAFHVCVTSYQLVLSDQHIFRRKPWHYMILDEAHHIKNFRSQRWQTLLGFNARHRLLLTGTPLQNNLMELWSLLYFLMPSGMLQEGKGPFADHADFQAWFSNPMEKAIENGEAMDEETKATVAKLHTVLRPYLLRRLKAEVETQMPGKTESIVYCRLSKRQRFLYDDFMSRSQTRETLGSGHFLSIINCLMQLRKVCNHPDLFEVRPIVTSFAMSRSVASEFETKELLVRKRLLNEEPISKIDWTSLTLIKPNRELSVSTIASTSTLRLDAASKLSSLHITPSDFDPLQEPPRDTQTIAGWKRYREWTQHRDSLERLKNMALVNTRRCQDSMPYLGSELLHLLSTPSREIALLPLEVLASNRPSHDISLILPNLVKSNNTRAEAADGLVSRFGFVTPKVKALDMPRHALSGLTLSQAQEIESFAPVSILQRASAKLSVAFPDRSLLQYDCGKLQKLDELLRECKAGGHRVLIFTQMTKVLDILEIFLSFHGHRYLRLDGSTKIEQRQIITERFNSNDKILCFISSTRSGGLGINLQGADTVIFYDSDWNPALDRQCQDRAHRIGQTREVRIWRFVTEHSIEENMLKKANQKRRLDEMVIAEGDFTTDYLAKLDWRDYLDEGQLKDLGVDETGDGTGEGGGGGGGETAAEVRMALAAAEDEEDAAAAKAAEGELQVDISDFVEGAVAPITVEEEVQEELGEVDPLAGTVDGFMCRFVDENFELFD